MMRYQMDDQEVPLDLGMRSKVPLCDRSSNRWCVAAAFRSSPPRFKVHLTAAYRLELADKRSNRDQDPDVNVDRGQPRAVLNLGWDVSAVQPHPFKNHDLEYNCFHDHGLNTLLSEL